MGRLSDASNREKLFPPWTPKKGGRKWCHLGPVRAIVMEGNRENCPTLAPLFFHLLLKQVADMKMAWVVTATEVTSTHRAGQKEVATE